MDKKQIIPNTTLFPVAVVVISCCDETGDNLITLNRVASLNAEPPMIGISVRPGRASHAMIANSGEFGLNIPGAEHKLITDYLGVTTRTDTDKWADTGLTRLPAHKISAPLIAEFPVNLECVVRQQITLPSHTLFIAEVMTIHAEASLVNAKGEINFDLGTTGLLYDSSAVRERPTTQASPQKLLAQIKK